jgi:hypothetical protein
MAAPYTNIKFSDAAMPRIASAAGYNATPYNKEGFQQFLAQNPDAKAKYEQFQQQAVGTMMAARGGVVRFVDGGMVKKYAEGGTTGANVEPVRTAVDNILQKMEEQQNTQAAPTAQLTTREQDDLQRLGSIRQDKLTDEEIQRLNDLRTSVDFSYNGETLSGNDARNRYDEISRKRTDQITPEDREYVSQYRNFYGYAPVPSGTVDSPAIINRTTAMMEGLTPEGEPILTKDMTVDAFGVPVQEEQLISEGTGQLSGTTPTVDTSVAEATTAAPVVQTPTSTVDATKTGEAVQEQVDKLQAEQGTVSQAMVAEEDYDTNVSNVKAAQGEGIVLNNEVTREIQEGELVSPAANAEKAAEFTERVQAATATPTEKATVRGQLEDLYADFDAKDPPAWAAGAMRAANATMAARGLSASSLAGQAVVQAAMEAAVPIAQADASVFAQFETQNLSNRQQRAMLAAQQRAQFMGQEFDQAFQSRVVNASRIADIANMNFTAEQQVQLENSRIANTMNLQNLSNRQAMTVAEAAALANLEMASLNNRQQAAAMNAQNFLQMDLANLNNRQQTSLFKSQQTIQSLFNDAAAENAARQFNAQSENQTNQFFANLRTSVDQFNAAQSNAMNQFNAGQANSVAQFNANLQNQREQFNAQNALVISQSNATWRRQIATADTAALNRANELNARSTLELSTLAYNNTWQLYKDMFEFAFQAEEGRLERENRLATAKIAASDKDGGGSGSVFGQIAGAATSALITSFISDIRLKKNIEVLKDFGNGIKMYKWDWRDKAIDFDVNTRQNRGFIAQNVLKYFPSLVHKDEEIGYYKVNYLGVVKKCMG